MQVVFSARCRYFMHAQSVDLRKGFDTLSGLVTNEFLQSPVSGDVFIFLNRPRNRIKLLHWQGDGFAIYYKRLEQGTYEFPKAEVRNNSIQLSHHHLQFILDGIILSGIKKRKRFELAIVDN